MTEATDAASWSGIAARRPRARVSRRSLYLTMRDGVRIAVDVHLPASDAPLPAIVRATRYYRGIRLRQPFASLPIEWLIDHAARTRERFLAHGYAWVDVCARGSGASFGSRPCPWSPDEIADGREVLAWVSEQPWCSGRIGATGVSYDGTASDFLVVAGHPALRAIAPRFSLFDTYADVAFPGGIHLSGFTAEWSQFNRALDTGRLDEAFAKKLLMQIRAWRAGGRHGHPLRRAIDALGDERLSRLAAVALRYVAPGVQMVDGDDGALLAAAVREHLANFDVHAGALNIACRDDTGVNDAYPDTSIDSFSPHSHIEALRASDAAVYGMSGWMDGAYSHSAVKRFRSLPGSQLILGPWEHGGMQNVSPYGRARKSAFDQDGELVRFFDRELRGQGEGDPQVRYFTVGEERWKSADAWPPPQSLPQRWYLGRGGLLSRSAPEEGAAELRVDASLGMGPRTRYDALLGLLPAVGYPHHAEVDGRMLVFRSEPLDRAVEITGHPVVRVTVSASEDDLFLFAYLQEELPDGTVHWMSDGQLRAQHRKLAARTSYDSPAPQHSFLRADMMPLDRGRHELVFDLLPLSWRVGRGHRLRLALSGSDSDHFTAPPGGSFAVHFGASCIELPIVSE